MIVSEVAEKEVFDAAKKLILIILINSQNV